MAASNKYSNVGRGLAAPFTFCESVTPSDVTDLTNTSRAIYVGGTGDLAVITKDGQTVTFKAVPVGTFIPIAATRVMSTNTTATLILSLA